MIKLAVPDIGQEELDAVKKVFDSKMLVQGECVEEFEKLVEDFLGVKHAIAVSSGTAALHLALLALDIKVGDEVIVPDFTFPATANAVEVLGATTKITDIELDSFCMKVDEIEKLITPKTKAIMPVQEFGQSTDMESVWHVAEKHNLRIIEDAACALGAEYKGSKVGTLGDIGCFSLHPRKAITSGEGGIVTTNDDMLASRVRMLRNHGMCYENGKVVFKMAGLNYRMTNIQGAIASVQMKKIEKFNVARRELVKKYNELLTGIEGVTLPKELPYGKSVWQTYHIILSDKYNRNKVIELLRENGVESNIGAYALHQQEYYKEKYNLDSNMYKNATNAYERGLALPLYYGMTMDQVREVVEQLKRAIEV